MAFIKFHSFSHHLMARTLLNYNTHMLIFVNYCTARKCPESADETHNDKLPRSKLAAATNSSNPIEFCKNPNQPSITYKRGENNRSFQCSWSARRHRLDWDESLEKVMCHSCQMIHAMGMLKFSKNADPTFIKISISNWKESTRCFNKN